MSFHVYLLYSKELNRYYTGYTSQKIDERLAYHLGNHSGFTSRTKDWEVVWTEDVIDKSEALILERKIKKRGASRFIKEFGIFLEFGISEANPYGYLLGFYLHTQKEIREFIAFILMENKNL